jgi:RNA polymerase sigma-70 factor (ECF subfamily)
MVTEMQPRIDPTGLMDVRYAAFLQTVVDLRPRLHRYCARMTGSALDGEDIMQDTLFEAYRKIDQLDEAGALRPWIFRIAHNRCIDFLRQRKTRRRAETGDGVEPPIVQPPEMPGANRAIERLVIHLPPKERASVLLKEVFDYSIEEIADLVGSTVGGVKSALKRGRTKLAALPTQRNARQSMPRDPDLQYLLRRYVDLFNRQDWDGVRALASSDAQLTVADCYDGQLSGSPYFAEYERIKEPWRLAIGEIDGEVVLIKMTGTGRGWVPGHAIRIYVEAGVVVRIKDYYACPWLLPAARSMDVAEGLPPSGNHRGRSEDGWRLT